MSHPDHLPLPTSPLPARLRLSVWTFSSPTGAHASSALFPGVIDGLSVLPDEQSRLASDHLISPVLLKPPPITLLLIHAGPITTTATASLLLQRPPIPTLIALWELINYPVSASLILGPNFHLAVSSDITSFNGSLTVVHESEWIVWGTCVDFGLRRILHSFVLDDVVGNLAANQRLHVHPLQGHHCA